MKTNLFDSMSVRELMKYVRSQWVGITEDADYYISLLEKMDKLTDVVDGNRGVQVAAFFLIKSRKFRGEMARLIKRSLRDRINEIV